MCGESVADGAREVHVWGSGLETDDRRVALRQDRER